MKILIGTNNENKIREIKQIFANELKDGFEAVSLKDLNAEPFEPEETGETLEENALAKAKAFYEKTGIPAFADDTGLEIDALNGKPGVRSARYAGEKRDDSANRAKVLEELRNVSLENRTARFRTVVCFYDGREPIFFEGVREGRIIESEKGKGGFGYDSIFVPQGYDKTFAELSPEEKNKISHRGAALRKFIDFLSRTRRP